MLPTSRAGIRVQQIDIYYKFNIAVSTAIADNKKYDKRERLRSCSLSQNSKILLTIVSLFGWLFRQTEAIS